MHTQYDAIYLSPHLDDAALSCGGQIFQRVQSGQKVLVLTVMAGNTESKNLSGFADLLHTRWELENDIVAQRRIEDVTACQILGADYLHWPIPDCIYRINPQSGEFFYTSETAIFGSVAAQEQELIDHLAVRLANLPITGEILAPLTIGNHIDHQIVRRAAERCCGDLLNYYEDYPYAMIPGALEAALEKSGENWLSYSIPLTEAALTARFDAVAAFKSQISTFFKDRADLKRQIRDYCIQVGGERLWKK